MARGKQQSKARNPVKTLVGKFTGPSTQVLKAILEYRLTLEIMEAFEEDTHRRRKPYRSAGCDDYCCDLMHGKL